MRRSTREMGGFPLGLWLDCRSLEEEEEEEFKVASNKGSRLASLPFPRGQPWQVRTDDHKEKERVWTDETKLRATAPFPVRGPPPFVRGGACKSQQDCGLGV